jgi:hypothetical protein
MAKAEIFHVCGFSTFEAAMDGKGAIADFQ